jgi:hypothetical protein
MARAKTDERSYFMRSHSLIKSRFMLVTLCGISLGAGILAFRAQADPWDKKTILTVDQPIQVTDRLLEPGKYVFKLADSNSDRHIVQIFNGDQSRIIDTILAIPNYRLQPTGKSQFMFWETPAGNAKALRAWFYPGDNFGQEFRYPKQLVALNMPQPAAPAPSPEPVAAAPQEPSPQPTVQQPPKEEHPVEMAQNNPPPPAAAPPAPAEPEPEKLPKTASPYPLIGLSGLLSLGAYGLLRLTRSA